MHGYVCIHGQREEKEKGKVKTSLYLDEIRRLQVVMEELIWLLYFMLLKLS